MAEQGYANSVYAAVYSGIQVYEMICRGIAVMRRHSDSWLNATQLLKVAGVEKGRRTKILEREVLTGVHEKIQGGYGKYQGTWVPFSRGVQLCKQYGVYEYVRPILEHDPTASGTRPDKTPTKAEVRRLMKSTQKSASGRSVGVLSSSVKRDHYGSQSTSTKRYKANSSAATSPLHSDMLGAYPPLNGHVPSTPAFMRDERVDSVPRIPSNSFHQTLYSSPATGFAVDNLAPPPAMSWPQQTEEPSSQTLVETDSDMQTKSDRMRLMNIFLNEDAGYIPEWLADDAIQSQINVNLVIDDQGHTAVHWAAALARIQVLDLLLFRNADPRKLNYEGESALVRAVQVTNNFENQTFPDLLELLHDTIPLTDKYNRTVLHHISLAAGNEGREKAARYYADCLLSWIVRLAGGYQVDGEDADKLPSSSSQAAAESESKNLHSPDSQHTAGNGANGLQPLASSKVESQTSNADFAAFLNLQDVHGNTALNIAARAGDRAMVRMLLNAGASATIPNRVGLCPMDFGVDKIAEDDHSSISDQAYDDTLPNAGATTPRRSRVDAIDTIASPTPSRRGHSHTLMPQTPLRSALRGTNKNLLASLMSPSESLPQDTRDEGMWSPASAEQRMHDSVLKIQGLMSDLESEFAGELKTKHSHFDGIKQQLRNTTIELAKARDTIHKLHSKASQLEEVNSRVAYLEETLARETSAVRNAIDALPEDSKPRRDLVAMLDTILALPDPNDDQNDDLPLVPASAADDIDIEQEQDPAKLQAAVERLRLVNQIYARRDELLRERVMALRKRADVSERERQYRQIIASCCEISEADVDLWIDKLVSAVESNDDGDLVSPLSNGVADSQQQLANSSSSPATTTTTATTANFKELPDQPINQSSLPIS
ncbi:transcriptional regulator swi6 [Coemansia sp. RSA 989]|nr:transcriptional regulator swi6 [Coemansia sp. RSA 1086]KAJ1752633.1 transcriptional regulator swi6 [Coemansia sp. RSA 1821]KAJ1867843.1 transcriptional regulator swi6 [Coemansia sp. RSA 989]KAJ1874667.1 transcriptional regulator swi6 [Coemansia sp. RSA 990]KAJ2651295.1 transcriptional regulator swi6 [Coemansia sp. RSA 1250]KAJ2673726.1 transcriptional regulator swi6 [Coemansia sp. RSA 1085]